MMNRSVCVVVLSVILASGWVRGRAQDVAGPSAGRRPMTFADLQRMKRVGDPQISPSGRWVMFSVTDVDLETNLKVNHLWVVPFGGAEPTSQGLNMGHPRSGERQV